MVTSQTLYAATAASLREYAVLQALGIPRWRMALSVLGTVVLDRRLGVMIALPTVYALKYAADSAGAKSSCGGGLDVCHWCDDYDGPVSGVAALRSLRMVEPATLLR